MNQACPPTLARADDGSSDPVRTRLRTHLPAYPYPVRTRLRTHLRTHIRTRLRTHPSPCLHEPISLLTRTHLPAYTNPYPVRTRLPASSSTPLPSLLPSVSAALYIPSSSPQIPPPRALSPSLPPSRPPALPFLLPCSLSLGTDPSLSMSQPGSESVCVPAVTRTRPGI